MWNMQRLVDVIFRLAAVTVLLLVTLVVGNCTYSMHADKKELQDVARRIQRQCLAARRCPEGMPGWEQLRPGVFRGEKFRYSVAADGKSFHLNRHFGPDWDYEATGGVNSPLVFKENIH